MGDVLFLSVARLEHFGAEKYALQSLREVRLSLWEERHPSHPHLSFLTQPAFAPCHTLYCGHPRVREVGCNIFQKFPKPAAAVLYRRRRMPQEAGIIRVPHRSLPQHKETSSFGGCTSQ